MNCANGIAKSGRTATTRMICLLVFQVIFELCTGSVDREGNPHWRGNSRLSSLKKLVQISCFSYWRSIT